MSNKLPLDQKDIERIARDILDKDGYKNYEIITVTHTNSNFWTVQAIVENLTITLLIEYSTGKLLQKIESRKHFANIVEPHIEVSDNLVIELKKYFEKDSDTLYAELGKIEGSVSRVKVAKKIDFLDRGKRTIEYFHDTLYQKICVDFEYCKKNNQINNWTPISLATLLIQLLLPLLGTTIPVWVPVPLVTVILVKGGLSKFCKC